MVVSWLFSPKVTLARLVQPSNAPLPMVVTPAGIEILSRLVQAEKTESLMVVTAVGIEISTRLAQP